MESERERERSLLAGDRFDQRERFIKSKKGPKKLSMKLGKDNHLVFGFVQACVNSSCLSLFLTPSRSSSTPLYPSKVL